MMNFLEKMIEKHESTLREMEANPDPTQLRSNRLGRELELSGYRATLEAWQQGKPLLPYFPSTNLARAMGSQNLIYGDMFLHLQVLEDIPRYIQAALNMGIAEYACDFVNVPNAAAILGELPPPSLSVVCSYVNCRVWPYHMKVLAEHFNVPKFELDTPQGYSEESIKYLADQLGELIEFAESKVPSLKYDQDKHLELIEASRIWVNYCTKDWELRKHVPLLVDSKDIIAVPYHFEPALYGETAKVLEFWRVRTEEIEARAAAGVDREEKLRFLWVTPPPLYVDPIAILERRGVSVPGVVLPPDLLYYGMLPNCWGDEKEFGRKLSPLEEEARVIIGSVRSSEGLKWADGIIRMCQDLKCDAVVFFQFASCLHYCSLNRFITGELERKLGVPTLILETRNFDSTFLPPAEFESRLMQFVDIVLARKGRD